MTLFKEIKLKDYKIKITKRTDSYGFIKVRAKNKYDAIEEALRRARTGDLPLKEGGAIYLHNLEEN